jgi:hypothetical protein
MPDVISILELTANFDSACDETDGEAPEAEDEKYGNVRKDRYDVLRISQPQQSLRDDRDHVSIFPIGIKLLGQLILCCCRGRVPAKSFAGDLAANPPQEGLMSALETRSG